MYPERDRGALLEMMIESWQLASDTLREQNSLVDWSGVEEEPRPEEAREVCIPLHTPPLR
jgi:hypothetical protein